MDQDSKPRLVEAVSADYQLLEDGRAPHGLTLPEGGAMPREAAKALALLCGRLKADPGWGSYLIVSEGMVAGAIGLLREPQGGSGEFGFEVAEGLRRRGIGAAALDEFLSIARSNGLDQLNALTRPDNSVSASMLESAGFTCDGGDPLRWRLQLAQSDAA